MHRRAGATSAMPGAAGNATGIRRPAPPGGTGWAMRGRAVILLAIAAALGACERTGTYYGGHDYYQGAYYSDPDPYPYPWYYGRRVEVRDRDADRDLDELRRQADRQREIRARREEAAVAKENRARSRRAEYDRARPDRPDRPREARPEQPRGESGRIIWPIEGGRRSAIGGRQR
jgi:hypothetical protein